MMERIDTEETEITWVRLELLCVTFTAYFREDSINDLQLVFTNAEVPCIAVELVSQNGERESLGLKFDGNLVLAREGAARMAAEYGLPLVDCTAPDMRRVVN